MQKGPRVSSSAHGTLQHEEIVVSGEHMVVDVNEHVQHGLEPMAMGMSFRFSGVCVHPCSLSVEQ